MPTLKLKYKRVPANPVKYGEGFTINSLPKEDFHSFNKKLLGLGDIGMDGKYINSLAVFLDLEGFTQFCNQIDSNLIIPEFISRYTEWIFEKIKSLFVEEENTDRVTIWGSLPIYSKFLGDGILFLWDTEISGGSSGIGNIISNLLKVTISYKTEFLPLIKTHVSLPPAALRCGIARGQIISIGNGEDYVGSCINLAARLQKVSDFTFSVSRTGFDLSKLNSHKLSSKLIQITTNIKDIGENVLIYVRKDEFDKLSKEEKKQFKKT